MAESFGIGDAALSICCPLYGLYKGYKVATSTESGQRAERAFMSNFRDNKTGEFSWEQTFKTVAVQAVAPWAMPFYGYQNSQEAEQGFQENQRREREINGEISNNANQNNVYNNSAVQQNPFEAF